MQQRFTRARALAIAIAGATAASLVVAPTAGAAVDGTKVVISEVYGGGGNSGSVVSNDFVELYNPHSTAISIDGWTLVRYSGSGNPQGDTVTLSGTIEPGQHFLIQAAKGSSDTGALPTPDLDGGNKPAFSGTGAAAEILDAGGNRVDLIGWGGNAVFEGAAAGSTSNSTSIQRTDPTVDTDNNAADFTVGTPTPTNSLGETAGAGDGGENEVPGEHGAAITIAEIQGTAAASPMANQTVTTEGVVTAAYPEGGKNGFYLQTAGTGTEPKAPGAASDGIFVYLGTNPAAADFPEIGDSLTVTGTANEYYEATQITASLVTEVAESLGTVTALEIETLPAGAAAREVYEGMLIQPTGEHTVTNNYALNTHGTIDLAPGTEAFMQATDVHTPSTDPSSPVQQLMAEQAAASITLDDGRTRNYMNSDKQTPLPWIAQDNAATIKSLRTGDGVDFQGPVVLDYSFDAWTFQPTSPVTGNTAGTALPITWEDSRPAELGAMDTVQGGLSIATFNVLNYFTTLGKDESCSSYKDMYGDPVAVSGGCDVRGAYSEQAFENQQTKIVNAINKLDASVVSLEEIENTASVSGNTADRDESLSALVDALNAKEGTDKWEFVESPSVLGQDEDVIRVAFIYQPAEVTPVGESRIFNDAAFTGLARQPLAQEFTSATDPEAGSFVAITNHFKSKGSVTRGDADIGDGQANNPNVRNDQSQALLDHLGNQEDWTDKPVFVLGDLNAYAKETAIATLEANGFSNIVTKYDAGETYQFDGRIGSLDHALGNQAAMDTIVDAEVWDINGDESIAFEYSRRHYNTVDFHDDSPFRSSDHDPIKVGFNLGEAPNPGENPDEGENEGKVVAGFEINDAGHLIVTYTDETTKDLGKVVGTDGAAGEDGQDGADGANGEDGQDGRGIATISVNAEDELIVTYTDGTFQNLGKVKGENGTNGTDGTDGTDGADGADGTDGRDGKDGGSILETVFGFAAGFTAMGGIVAWLVNTFFPEIRNGVLNQFNSMFR
ncbi:ExeM/NucH family extracellular endonuclease [Corynebacterium sp. A21]|uniref:ExeM/NucH family extracellular endonuclease n=1 Tax=Corynebacterium sp. A21 TaxID=3457318 RepID=UPI003FCF1FDF